MSLSPSSLKEKTIGYAGFVPMISDQVGVSTGRAFEQCAYDMANSNRYYS